MKELTTVAEVLVACGYAADFVPDVSAWPEEMRAKKSNEFYLLMAVRAVNGEWKPNWDDHTQCKYVMHVRRSIADVVSERALHSHIGVVDAAYSGVPKRLAFASEEKALHFFEHFRGLLEAYYLG